MEEHGRPPIERPTIARLWNKWGPTGLIVDWFFKYWFITKHCWLQSWLMSKITHECKPMDKFVRSRALFRFTVPSLRKWIAQRHICQEGLSWDPNNKKHEVFWSCPTISEVMLRGSVCWGGAAYFRLTNVKWFPFFPYYRLITIIWFPWTPLLSACLMIPLLLTIGYLMLDDSLSWK